MKLDTKEIALNAIIACIYAALTLAIAPLAYSEVQFRISEVMVFLAFYNRKYIPGLVIGCFLSNIPSSLGWMDMVFGTFSTLVVVMTMNKVNNRYTASVLGALITGVIVGFELHLAFGIPFLINAIYVAIGEFGVLLIGAILFKTIENNPNVKRYLEE